MDTPEIFSTGDWQKDEAILRDNNVPDNEILQEKQKQYQYLVDNGLPEADAKAHFGIKESDMSDVTKIFQDNLKTYEFKDGDNPLKKIWHGLGAGFENSTGALMYRAAHGDKVITPDMLNPQQGDMFYRSAQQVGQLTGDLPAMAVGSAFGSMVGGAFGMGVGTGVAGPAGTLPGFAVGAEGGSMVGTFAMPAAIRSALIDKYKNGEFKSFGDFWERASAAFVETSKAAALGGATYGAGQTGKALAGMAKASQGVATTAAMGSELATMVTVGSYMEGHTPTWQDFATGAFTLAAVHGVSTGVNIATQHKLADIWAKTGKTPEEVIQDAELHPEFKQELLSNSFETPDFYPPEQLPASKESGSIPVENNLPVRAGGGAGEPPQLPPGAEPRDVTPPNEVGPVIPEAPPTDLQKAQNDVLDSIGFKDEIKPYSIKDSPYYSVRAMYQNANLVIKKAQDIIAGKIPVDEKNAFSVISLFDTWRNVHETFLKEGTRDFATNKKNGESYKTIVDDVNKSGGDLKGLAAYRISKRDIEIAAQGKKTPRDLLNAQKIVAETEHLYEPLNRRIQEWKNRVMDYGVQGGIFKQSHIEFLQDEHLNHVSFRPIIEGADGEFFGTQKSTVNKEQKGTSERNLIQNPFTSDMENAEAIIKEVEKNKVKKTIVDMLSADKETSGLVQIENPSADTKAIELWAKSEDIELSKDQYKILHDLYSVKSLAPDEISYKVNGETSTFKVDPLIAKVANELGTADNVGMFLKMSKTIVGLTRFGLTETNLGWGLGNTIRDSWTALIKSKVRNPGDLINHALSIANTIPHILGKTPEYWDYIYNRGASGNLINTREMVTDAFKMEIKLGSDKESMKNKVYNQVNNVKQFAASAWDIFDMPNRMAEYNRQKAAGANQIEAAAGSHEITTDFSQKGISEFNRKWNAATAFRGAAINGFFNIKDTVERNGKGIATLGLGTITVPAVTLWLANKDDERWRRLGTWEKLQYLHYSSDDWQIPKKEDQPLVEAYKAYGSKLLKYDENGSPLINKGETHRVKLPEVLGVLFAGLPILMMDKAFVDDPVSTEKIMQDFISTFSANQTPTALVPVVEQLANKNMFSNSQLVNQQAENALPEVKYSNYTSETAKMLSRFVRPVPSASHPFSEEDTKYLTEVERMALPVVEGAVNTVKDAATSALNIKPFGFGQEFTAPAVIDNYVKQWTGGLGNYVLDIADKGLSLAELTKVKEKSADHWSDVPVLKAFFSRQFSGSGVYPNQFREEFKEHKQIADTLSVLMANKEFDKYTELLQTPEGKAAKVLGGFNDTINGLRNVLMTIDVRTDITPLEKRQLADSYYYQIDQIAKRGLIINRQIKQDIENSNKGN